MEQHISEQKEQISALELQMREQEDEWQRAEQELVERCEGLEQELLLKQQECDEITEQALQEIEAKDQELEELRSNLQIE